MANRIPKSAQRAIDKANRDRLARAEVQQRQLADLPVPRVMAIGMTPRTVMNLYDVYFNGEKQLLCTLANVDKGLIRRWDRGRGNVPAKDAQQVELFGKVEIKRRGT